MGRVIDSTNMIDTSFQSKSRVYKNKNTDNYYLKSLQQKIDAEWKYRYNVIDVEEENEKGTERYEPTEAVVQTVYDPVLKTELSDDWKNLVFRDLTHKVPRGKRYRFSLDFDPMVEDKDKCIWLALNSNAESPTASCVVKRCNSLLTYVSDQGNIHYEPAVLEDSTKNINFWRDETIVLAQGEIEIIVQYNKYTKNTKINDRFFIGETDLRDEQNNWIYKVKAIRKYQSSKTYDLSDIPLMYVVLEKDDLGPNDDRKLRVAVNSPIYYEDDFFKEGGEEEKPTPPDVNELDIRMIEKESGEYIPKILLNDIREYSVYLYNKDEKVIQDIDVTFDLLSTDKDEYYYEYEIVNGNEFIITNKKMYLKDKLQITCSTVFEGETIEKVFLIELGGYS